MTEEVRYKCNTHTDIEDKDKVEMFDHLITQHLDEMLEIIDDYWIDIE